MWQRTNKEQRFVLNGTMHNNTFEYRCKRMQEEISLTHAHTVPWTVFSYNPLKVTQVTIVCCIWHACTADYDWQRANTGAKCYHVPCRNVLSALVFTITASASLSSHSAQTTTTLKHKKKENQKKTELTPCVLMGKQLALPAVQPVC